MREYSEKELAIFCGVLRLAEQGIPVQEITSKQIAAAAGMGKATIYDYFSSKEEIILQAIVYAAGRQNRTVEEKLSRAPDFKGKMMCIYREIINTVENSFSVFNLISYLGQQKDISTFHSRENIRQVEEIMTKTHRLLMDVINRGVGEGVISPQNHGYLRMALESNIIATGKARMNKTLPPEIICENAYTMLVKTLG